jgi:hypothetical protein
MLCYTGIYNENDAFAQEALAPRRKILRQCHKIRLKRKWATRDEVVNWLFSVGIEVKYGTENRYIIMGRVYSINHIMILANKKRIELGLEPFYMEGVTEF